MTRATSNLLDPNVPSARANGNAIIAGLDNATEDGDAGCALKVDPVGVRASTWSSQCQVLQRYVVAADYAYVHLLAVE